MMVLLDVVYNHFGPEGNYLGWYAPQFFTDRHRTPWGDGINFDGPESRTVRDFFIHNALYWLTEYHFDGLRLDAVHAIADDSSPDILTELADAVRSSDRTGASPPRPGKRPQSGSLPSTRINGSCQPRTYTAQWNDDIHHALHVLITGEKDGYYSDYSERPLDQLGRCLVEGFAYQGEPSLHRNGATRGEPTAACRPPHLSHSCRIMIRLETVRSASGSPSLRIRARSVRHGNSSARPFATVAFHGRRVRSGNSVSLFLRFREGPGCGSYCRSGETSSLVSLGSMTLLERERIPDPNAAQPLKLPRLDWSIIEQSQSCRLARFLSPLLKLRGLTSFPAFSGVQARCGLRTPWTRGLTACVGSSRTTRNSL
jgi:maltooligosyltrehalose trehalohydrolase